MIFKRNIYKDLLKWKANPERKPLLLRGGRQVGKTTLIREFSKEFDFFIELNLEKREDNELFDLPSVQRIMNVIFLTKGIKPGNSSILLFIDEIQENAQAIQFLRFFYEEMPQIYVVAAGSQLEFVLGKVKSFPVGRIELMYLHPLNFEEFLLAKGNEVAIEALKQIPFQNDFFTPLLHLFNEYAVIGGMPEIVKTYLKNNSTLGLPMVYRRLWEAYKNDAEKYGRNSSEIAVIRHVLEAAPSENNRIVFEGFGNSNYKSREVSEALNALDLARIIQLIYPTTDLTPPISNNRRKRPRLQFLDTGLLFQAMNIQSEILKLDDIMDIQKGRLIQHLVNQELISVHSFHAYKPNFWVRDEKGKSSEVDLVYPFGKYVIPIEIKSGKSGTLRSLHQFMDRVDHHFAIRLYANELKLEVSKTIKGKPFYLLNLPYLLGTQIPNYVKWLVKNYPHEPINELN